MAPPPLFHRSLKDQILYFCCWALPLDVYSDCVAKVVEGLTLSDVGRHMFHCLGLNVGQCGPPWSKPLHRAEESPCSLLTVLAYCDVAVNLLSYT